MAAHGVKFCTSVSILIVLIYVSSTPLHDFDLQILFGSALETFTTVDEVFRQNTTGPVLHIRVLERIHYFRVA